VVGPQIARDEDLFGRAVECEALLELVRVGRSAQIVGEERIGTSSLLRWVERHAGEWQGRPIARVNAQGRAGRSPAEFIREAALSLGKGRQIEAIWAQKGNGKSDEALLVEEALYELVPFVLLVDEADALLRDSRFPGRFFSVLRALCQDGRVSWVSCSHGDLRRASRLDPVVSRFLNDAGLVLVGSIGEASARELLERGLQPGQVDLAIEAAGGFVYLLQFLGDGLWRAPGDSVAAVDRLSIGVAPVLGRWWNRRSQNERYLLKRMVRGVSVGDLTVRERQQSRGLVDLGLAIEKDDAFSVPSAAWRKFVELA
jgi:hypothetical protein